MMTDSQDAAIQRLQDEALDLDLASRIRARREEIGFTQNQVARALDIQVGVYQRWEAGAVVPRGAIFYRLCVLFDWPHPLRDTNNLRSEYLALYLDERYPSPPDNRSGVEVDDRRELLSVGMPDA